MFTEYKLLQVINEIVRLYYDNLSINMSKFKLNILENFKTIRIKNRTFVLIFVWKVGVNQSFVSGKESNDNHFWAHNNKLQKNSFQNFFSSFLHKMTMQVIRIAFLTSHLYVVRYCFWAAPCIISVLKRPRNDFV